MQKRGNFYKDGSFIPFSLPQDFRPALGKEACGNCAWYSNARGWCNTYSTKGVKDNYICNKWRVRYFKR